MPFPLPLPSPHFPLACIAWAFRIFPIIHCPVLPSFLPCILLTRPDCGTLSGRCTLAHVLPRRCTCTTPKYGRPDSSPAPCPATLSITPQKNYLIPFISVTFESHRLCAVLSPSDHVSHTGRLPRNPIRRLPIGVAAHAFQPRPTYPRPVAYSPLPPPRRVPAKPTMEDGPQILPPPSIEPISRPSSTSTSASASLTQLPGISSLAASNGASTSSPQLR